MPWAMVINVPGRKNASGVTGPHDNTAAWPLTAASASSDPANTIVSVENRLPMRVEMKLPVKNPKGNNRK